MVFNRTAVVWNSSSLHNAKKKAQYRRCKKLSIDHSISNTHSRRICKDLVRFCPRSKPTWPVGRFASSRSRSKNSNSGSGNSFGPGWARDHRRRPRSGELKASPAFPPGRREGPPFSLHAVSSPALGGKGTDGLGISASRDARQPQEDVKKVDKGRRQRSVGGVLRRGWSRVVSYLTIMTTWVLFRILLKGLNKVSRPPPALRGALLCRELSGVRLVSRRYGIIISLLICGDCIVACFTRRLTVACLCIPLRKRRL